VNVDWTTFGVGEGYVDKKPKTLLEVGVADNYLNLTGMYYPSTAQLDGAITLYMTSPAAPAIIM
jgi:hypothetical protein